MIQSYKIDLFKMNIKSLSKKTLDFTIKRLAEITGISLICLSILLFVALFSYSPDDPNFIFSEKSEFKNLLGFKGSYTSDLFFQSIGLISFLLSFTIFFTGINLIRNKNFLIVVENIFYSIIYIILGSIFFTNFYTNSFWLPINGNGGFVGIFFQDTFFINLINLNESVSYYFLIISILFLFLISINFNLYFLKNLFKNLVIKIKSTKKSESESLDNYQSESEFTISEKLIQEDLPFDKKSKDEKIKYKFKLPLVDFLKKPTKAEREINSNDDKI